MNRCASFILLLFFIVVGIALWLATGWAQPPGTIVTVAGGSIGDGKAAIQASLRFPTGLTVDKLGALLILDTSHHRVRKVVPLGPITTLAGTGIEGISNDGGPATQAAVFPHTGIAIARVGNLYFTDLASQRIRKVDPQGIITTVAGNENSSFSGDGGAATATRLLNPRGIAVDGTGNLYIVEAFGVGRIRKVDSQGIIMTVAGGGNPPDFLGDGGAATQARLSSPTGVFVDIAGNLYIADSGYNRIRKVDVTTGIITTITGSGTVGLGLDNSGFSGDGGPATQAMLNRPSSVAVDKEGNVYIADTWNNRVRKVTLQGIIMTVARDGFSDPITGFGRFNGDEVSATQASLGNPNGVAVDDDGNLYISDSGNQRIRKVDANGIITTVAGGSVGDGDSATTANLETPSDIYVDATGAVYIADTENHRIRRVDSQGIISTVAGNEVGGFSGDEGQAVTAQLYLPYGVTVDEAGNLYVADKNNHRVRKVDANGIITTVAGNGIATFSFGGAAQGDGGPATQAGLSGPTGVAVDKTGNLYIADSRVRKVDSQGIITTIVGNGTRSFSGDGYPAIAATLYEPRGMAIDAAGNLYIADTGNHRIRKVDPQGIITTVAGLGTPLFYGDGGPATYAALSNPYGIVVDKTGNLYIADSGNNRVRKVDSQGIITTVAGNGMAGFSGDGSAATLASMSYPRSVAVDRFGNLYIADTGNNRIRKVVGAQISLMLNPDIISFGDVDTGAFKDFTITTTNTGNDTLRVSDIISASPVFTARPTSFKVPPNQSFSDTLRFAPTAGGPLSGTLLVVSNAFTSPDTIRVSGTGTTKTLAIPSDTGTVTFLAIDNTQASITFQLGIVHGHTITFETFGMTPPSVVQVVPSFSNPLLYFAIDTTIPSTVAFMARVILQYTSSQLAAAGITNENSLTVASFNPTTLTWTFISATVDTAANAVIFTTNHFSVWALASVGPTGIDTDHASQAIPRVFALKPNRPNPFNPTTQIAYDVPQTAHVTLAIYNVLGQEIIRLVDQVNAPGWYKVTWNGRNGQGQQAASGVYLYRLTSSTGFRQTKRMTLVK